MTIWDTLQTIMLICLGFLFGYWQSRPGAPVKTVEQARAVLLTEIKRKKQTDTKVGVVKRPSAADYRAKADPVAKAEDEAMTDTFKEMDIQP